MIAIIHALLHAVVGFKSTLYARVMWIITNLAAEMLFSWVHQMFYNFKMFKAVGFHHCFLGTTILYLWLPLRTNCNANIAMVTGGISLQRHPIRSPWQVRPPCKNLHIIPTHTDLPNGSGRKIYHTVPVCCYGIEQFHLQKLKMS